MHSDAMTPEEYLAGLDPSRREVLSEVREVVRTAMPEGYVETMAFGMIGWVVPLERYPDTYNGRPLSYVSLAAQKNYFSLYLMGVYSAEREAELRARWSGGRPLDMGKSCVRFRAVADLDLPLIAETIAAVQVDELIEVSRAASRRPGGASRRPAKG